jgi:hypothetical protein
MVRIIEDLDSYPFIQSPSTLQMDHHSSDHAPNDIIEEFFSAVLATISEDRTAGTSSHEEANLKSLDQGRGVLSLKTDSVNAPATTGGGNHALQDYQMQLMLLEQQNKKRLMMARQEQESYVPVSEDPVSEDPVPFLNECNGGIRRNIQNEEARTHLEELVEEEGNIENVLNSSVKRKARPKAKPKTSRKRRPTSPQLSDASCSSPSAKRRVNKHGNTNKKNDSHLTLAESYALPNPSPVPSPTTVHIPTLHRIVCRGSAYHSTDLFADVPQRLSDVTRYRGHFSGAKPVYDVEDFLSQSGELGFLVFKDYQCATKHNITSRSNNQDTLASDSISIVSIQLQELISRIAECPLVRANLRAPTNYYHSSTDPVINEFEIPSPYNFFFHHRAQLLDEVRSHKPKDDVSTHHSAITALLQYLEKDQGYVFREADKLFELGQTSVQHLQRLFRPNEVVIARFDNVHSAYVLRDWPSINQDSSWCLPCWSWGYDGSFFHRKDTNLTLHFRLGEVARITNLGVFPLRFAPEDLKNELIKRGKRFWDLRHKHYVSYNGWDIKREEFYVGRFHPLYGQG